MMFFPHVAEQFTEWLYYRNHLAAMGSDADNMQMLFTRMVGKTVLREKFCLYFSFNWCLGTFVAVPIPVVYSHGLI